jgi:hypothetical protein
MGFPWFSAGGVLSVDITKTTNDHRLNRQTDDLPIDHVATVLSDGFKATARLAGFGRAASTSDGLERQLKVALRSVTTKGGCERTAASRRRRSSDRGRPEAVGGKTGSGRAPVSKSE